MKSWLPTIVSCLGMITLSAVATAYALSVQASFGFCFMLVGGTCTLSVTFALGVHEAFRRIK